MPAGRQEKVECDFDVRSFSLRIFDYEGPDHR